jgi:hypothetical protein
MKLRLLLVLFGVCQVADGLWTLATLGFCRSYLTLGCAKIIARERYSRSENTTRFRQ